MRRHILIFIQISIPSSPSHLNRIFEILMLCYATTRTAYQHQSHEPSKYNVRHGNGEEMVSITHDQSI